MSGVEPVRRRLVDDGSRNETATMGATTGAVTSVTEEPACASR
jgi:hypothetical protein